MTEKELYERKSALLKRALARADKMDAEDAVKRRGEPCVRPGSAED